MGLLHDYAPSDGTFSSTTPQYAGDVISWAAGGARYQSLVRPRHRLELAAGHAAHLGRAVLGLEVADTWDEREQVFR